MTHSDKLLGQLFFLGLMIIISNNDGDNNNNNNNNNGTMTCVAMKVYFDTHFSLTNTASSLNNMKFCYSDKLGI